MELPLSVKRRGESYQVVDAAGRVIYLYFEDMPLRRTEMKRWTSAEAEALAKKIARFLTDDAERPAPPRKDDAG